MEDETKLKQELSDDFLSLLYKASVVFGDLGDSVAVRDFVEWCYQLAGKEYPESTTR